MGIYVFQILNENSLTVSQTTNSENILKKFDSKTVPIPMDNNFNYGCLLREKFENQCRKSICYIM